MFHHLIGRKKALGGFFSAGQTADVGFRKLLEERCCAAISLCHFVFVLVNFRCLTNQVQNEGVDSVDSSYIQKAHQLWSGAGG